MRDLNSQFKLEHLGINIGWNQFSDPSTTGKKIFRTPLVAKLAIPYCHKLMWVGGFQRKPGGGGSSPTCKPPMGIHFFSSPHHVPNCALKISPDLDVSLDRVHPNGPSIME